MKKLLSILCAVSLLWVLVPAETVSALAQERSVSSVVVNVKDFGAVGDGATDDRAAMMAAFDYAIANYAAHSLPVTVYFPEGEYGLLKGGMYIDLPFGSGNLTVQGAGADKSTIVYLDEWINGGSWVAIRLQLEKDPTSVDDYMHDITIQDLGVFDTNPDKHAWHVDKGDPGTEETHGFNIKHCVRATIKNCKTIDVGDECYDMTHCIDSLMTENVVIKNDLTGKGGGAISAGDGCENVLITNNLVVFDSSDPVICHYGIAVEALTETVKNITITNNTMQQVNGWGINIGAPKGVIENVLVQKNTMTNCKEGGIRFMGTGLTSGTRVLENYISDTHYGIFIDGGSKNNTLVDGCVIENLTSYGVSITSPRSNNNVIQNTIIRNAQWRAIYNAGTNTLFDRILIDGSGTAGNVTDSAVAQYPNGGNSKMTNAVILNCLNKKGIQGVQEVSNTLIEQTDVSGYVSISGAKVIKDCKVSRIIQAATGSTIDGLVLYTEVELGTHAITLSNSVDCIVANCVFTMPSKCAVREYGAADYNAITNNVVIGGSGISVLGSHTKVDKNVTGEKGATDLFRYRVVDGKATVTEWLDKTATSVNIPATIGEHPVVAVDAWAFALCDKLTSVTVPDSITMIGANAFYLCDALTDVKYIGSWTDWEMITVGDNNDALLSAIWHSPYALYSEKVGHSVMDTDHGNGLAFRFELAASGVSIAKGNRANLTNATVDYMGTECKLVDMGAVVTNVDTIGTDVFTLEQVNEQNVLNIPALYLQGVESNACAFAIRIIDIPTAALDRTIYVRPYCIIEWEGEQLVVYGSVDSAACADYM